MCACAASLILHSIQDSDTLSAKENMGSTSFLPSTGSVVVHIGNANVTGDGVNFTFRRDPTFSSVTPQMTIPA